MAIHHLTEYSLDGGAWVEAYADEEAGPGKTLTISSLASGTYSVRLRITPLTGGGPAVISSACELIIESSEVGVQSQIAQIQSIVGNMEFAAELAQIQAVQVSSSLATMLFTGMASQEQQIQVQSASGDGIMVLTGEVIQSQVQEQSLVSLLEFLATLSESQLQNQVNNGELGFSGVISESQTVQTSASSSALVFYSTVAESQTANSSLSSGSISVSFSGTVAESQAVQSESISGAASPATPQAPTLEVGDTTLTPSWNTVSGATSYNVYWKAGSTPTAKDGSDGATKITGATSGVAITGLTNGTTYYVCVTAVNAQGESNLSGEAHAAPVVLVTVTDTFERSDGGLGGAWATVTGATAPQILTGEVVAPSGADCRAVNTTTLNNAQYAEIDGVVGIDSLSEGSAGILLRAITTQRTGYEILIAELADVISVYTRKWVNGTLTPLGTVAVGLYAGEEGSEYVYTDITKLRAEITSAASPVITVKAWNGTWTTVGTYTDSTSPIGAGRIGLAVYKSARLGSISGGDL